MRLRWYPLVGMFLAALTAEAVQAQQMETGEDLLRLCQQDVAGCEPYISVTLQSEQITRKSGVGCSFELPESESVDGIRTALIDWLERHDEDRAAKINVISLITVAFADMYPCPAP